MWGPPSLGKNQQTDCNSVKEPAGGSFYRETGTEASVEPTSQQSLWRPLLEKVDGKEPFSYFHQTIKLVNEA